MPEYDDWIYERPDGDARKARGRTNLQDQEASPDQGVNASENERDAEHASEIGRDMPPDSGGTCLQDPEVTKKEDLNHQEEPPLGTGSEPASQSRPLDADAKIAQTTIDGTDEDLGPREPTIKDIANSIARRWIEYWDEKGTPVVGAGPKVLHAKMVSSVKGALERGYSEEEVRAALTKIGRPTIPTPDRLGEELAAGRGHVSPQRTGNGHRGAGAMAGTNLFIADLTPEQRRAQNPLANAVYASEFADDREGVRA
jgi:hypothetical protein